MAIDHIGEMRNMKNDLIRRKDAIDAIFKTCRRTCSLSHALEKVLEQLPSAQSELKRGKWVEAKGSWCTPGGDPVWECSECGKGRHVYGVEHGSYGGDVADGQWVSCPNCGAEMENNDD